MKTALLLIDIQNDYFPGGKMELEGPVEAAKKANELRGPINDVLDQTTELFTDRSAPSPAVRAELAPIQERAREFEEDESLVRRIINEGCAEL